MTINSQDEYKLPNNQVISIQFSVEGNCWEVGCWSDDDTAHWYKEFDNEIAARAEYERWRK